MSSPSIGAGVTPHPRFGFGAWDTRCWHPRPGFALRTHRRILWGYGRRRTQPTQLLAVLVRTVRGKPFVAPPPAHLEAFAVATGLGTEEQGRRLQRLAAHGIPPTVALRLGLIRDGWLEQWPEFVWDALLGWNLAASGLGQRRSFAALSDKTLTNRRLTEVGLPTVPGRELPRGTRSEAVRDCLGDHASLFVKPRRGSRGRDSFAVEADFVVTPYQSGHPVADARAVLDRVLADGPVLVQRRLTSHPDFHEAADAHDVTTMRVVTRWAGTRPTVFSAALELPRALGEGNAVYTILGVSRDGAVGPDVLPPWAPRRHDGELPEAVQRLVGKTLPHLAEAVAMAPIAHRQFPGVFAVAWDFALCADGPIFLEGNTGFGTVVPQWLSGGILGNL